MPPKRQGKKNAPAPRKPPVAAKEASAEGEDEKEVLERFTVELQWCVQQVEAAMQKKGAGKQGEDMVKAHRTLTSSKAPLIKKRQVMRALFGDYRAKMAQEETKIKIEPPRIKKQSVVPSSSQFLKKSGQQHGKPTCTNSPSTLVGAAQPEEDTKGNVVPNMSQVEGENTSVASPEGPGVSVNEGWHCAGRGDKVGAKMGDKSVTANSFKLTPSENSFKFNFSVMS